MGSRASGCWSLPRATLAGAQVRRRSGPRRARVAGDIWWEITPRLPVAAQGCRPEPPRLARPAGAQVHRRSGPRRACRRGRLAGCAAWPPPARVGRPPRPRRCAGSPIWPASSAPSPWTSWGRSRPRLPVAATWPLDWTTWVSWGASARNRAGASCGVRGLAGCQASALGGAQARRPDPRRARSRGHLTGCVAWPVAGRPLLPVAGSPPIWSASSTRRGVSWVRGLVGAQARRCPPLHLVLDLDCAEGVRTQEPGCRSLPRAALPRRCTRSGPRRAHRRGRLAGCAARPVAGRPPRRGILVGDHAPAAGRCHLAAQPEPRGRLGEHPPGTAPGRPGRGVRGLVSTWSPDACPPSPVSAAAPGSRPGPRRGRPDSGTRLPLAAQGRSALVLPVAARLAARLGHEGVLGSSRQEPPGEGGRSCPIWPSPTGRANLTHIAPLGVSCGVRGLADVERTIAGGASCQADPRRTRSRRGHLGGRSRPGCRSLPRVVLPSPCAGSLPIWSTSSAPSGRLGRIARLGRCTGSPGCRPAAADSRRARHRRGRPGGDHSPAAGHRPGLRRSADLTHVERTVGGVLRGARPGRSPGVRLAGVQARCQADPRRTRPRRGILVGAHAPRLPVAAQGRPALASAQVHRRSGPRRACRRGRLAGCAAWSGRRRARHRWGYPGGRSRPGCRLPPRAARPPVRRFADLSHVERVGASCGVRALAGRGRPPSPGCRPARLDILVGNHIRLLVPAQGRRSDPRRARVAGVSWRDCAAWPVHRLAGVRRCTWTAPRASRLRNPVAARRPRPASSASWTWSPIWPPPGCRTTAPPSLVRRFADLTHVERAAGGVLRGARPGRHLVAPSPWTSWWEVTPGCWPTSSAPSPGASWWEITPRLPVAATWPLDLNHVGVLGRSRSVWPSPTGRAGRPPTLAGAQGRRSDPHRAHRRGCKLPG